jgi:hypothetical protein
VGETETIISRLNAVLSSPNPVAVFRDLRDHRERTTVLRNRVALTRKTLAAIDARATKQYDSGELEQVRARRRDLERSLGASPTEQEDIQKRQMLVVNQFSDLGRELSRLEVDLLGMEARITATDRFMTHSMKGQNTESTNAVRAELVTQKAAIADYRKRMKELGLQIETGKLQVGVGDQDFQREAALRKEYNDLVERERQILHGLGAQLDPQVDAAFQRVANVEVMLDQHDQLIDAIVAERSNEMRQVLDEEGAKLTGYRTRLASLEGESEEVVGGIALDNYRKVRQRFYDLVLRADVGVIDVSWAVREEHRVRGEALARERARALQALQDEYRDIMDEQRGSTGP